VCRSEGYTSAQPCAHLDNRLVLRVENPAGSPGEHGAVVFEHNISPELAERIYAGALKAIHTFDDTPGQVVTDGTLFSVKLATLGSTAEARFTAADTSQMSSAVRELNGLLHETTHAF
jgi:hypothetical protein